MQGSATETDWTNATDTHTWNNFTLPGGMLGFSDGYGTVSVDNLNIKSDPDHNGSFDTTELVDTFTLDSSGYDAGSDPAYDNNGNLTYDGTQAYTYDAWNRLVKVAHAYRDSSGDVQKGSTFDTMAFDGLGRRISQAVTGEGSANDLTMHYYYSTANQILEERNGSDQTIKQQVWGVQYIDELVQEGINSNPSIDQTADTTYTVLQDANFNVTGIVNSNGTLVERYEYDAYGARTAYVNGGTNDAGLNLSSSQATRVVIGGVAQAYGIMDFGSQGLLHDDATGLIYNRARYRSTELDRFISAEPSGGTFYVDGSNLYQAVGDNPINGIDPTGLYLIAFDGTWDQERIPNAQAGIGNNNRDSLIVRFKNRYAQSKSYVRGTGNSTDYTGVGSQLAGGGWGARAKEFVQKEYDTLVAKYNANSNAGDRDIDIIGYSRGAFQALLLAKMIEERGIPDTATAYQANGKTFYSNCFKPKIRFLGLVDPVAQFNIPMTPLETVGWPTQAPSIVKNYVLLWAANNHSSVYHHTMIPGTAPMAQFTFKSFNDTHPSIGDDPKALEALINAAKSAGLPVN